MTASERNVRRFYWITALSNLWFVAANWLYFYRRYMNDGQLGILDAATFGIGFLVEIPSGALADRIGRKKLLIAGLILSSVSFLLHAFGGYGMIFVAQTCLTVGMAFISGADDALVYDSLVAEQKEGLWKKIVAKKYQIAIGATLASYLIGAVLYNIWFRLAFIVEGLLVIPAIYIAFQLTEAKTKAPSVSYVTNLIDGTKTLLKSQNIPYAILAIVFLGVGYAYDFGSLTGFSLDRVGIYATGQSVVLVVIGILSIGLLSQFQKVRSVRSEKIGLLVVSSAMIVGLVIGAASNNILVGAGSVIVIRLCSNILLPWLNDVVQHSVSSSHRATALSSLSVLYKLPYVIIAFLAGSFSASGRLSELMFFIAGFMLVGLISYIFMNRKLVD